MLRLVFEHAGIKYKVPIIFMLRFLIVWVPWKTCFGWIQILFRTFSITLVLFCAAPNIPQTTSESSRTGFLKGPPGAPGPLSKNHMLLFSHLSFSLFFFCAAHKISQTASESSLKRFSNGPTVEQCNVQNIWLLWYMWHARRSPASPGESLVAGVRCCFAKLSTSHCWL